MWRGQSLFFPALIFDPLLELLQFGLEQTNFQRRVFFRERPLDEGLLREELAGRNHNAANKNALE